MLISNGLTDEDWKKIIDGGMEELLEQYNADPEDKVPVQYIGPQIQLWPSKLQDFTPDQLFYFYNERDGVLDALGRKVEDGKVVYDPAQMKGACQIFYNPSGFNGFLAYLEEPLARFKMD